MALCCVLLMAGGRPSHGPGGERGEKKGKSERKDAIKIVIECNK